MVYKIVRTYFILTILSIMKVCHFFDHVCHFLFVFVIVCHFLFMHERAPSMEVVRTFNGLVIVEFVSKYFDTPLQTKTTSHIIENVVPETDHEVKVW